jgi:hypothetical protein
MVTTRDLEHVVAQVNVQFETLQKKITKLEEELKCQSQSQGKVKPKSK